MCKHHLGTIRGLNAKLGATEGDSGPPASRRAGSLFAQLQSASSAKEIRSLKSQVAELQQETMRLQTENARMSKSRGYNSSHWEMQETILGLKAKLRECARGEGHGEALQDGHTEDQSVVESTAMSQAFKLSQEKLAVEAQKVEILDLESKLADARKGLAAQTEEISRLCDKMVCNDQDLKDSVARSEERIAKLQAKLDAADEEVEGMKLSAETSRSAWERKVAELTQELERLRLAHVGIGVAVQEPQSEAAAIALMDMRAQTTSPQAPEVSRPVFVPGQRKSLGSCCTVETCFVDLMPLMPLSLTRK